MESQLHDDLLMDTRRQRRAEIRNVLALAIPNVILNSARALLDLVDFILVTRLNSPDAQAAILSAQLYLWVYSVFGMGVVTMASTFASQCLGKKQHREAGRYAWQTVYVSTFFGVIGLALYPILPWLFRVVGHEPGVMAMEVAYAQVALLSIGPTIASTGLAAFYTGIHRPYLAMWSVLEANVLN
ncbi:MAG: MATE family efflux transporter, partial [Planctomycetota bacterium]